jgi:hypothetical protein
VVIDVIVAAVIVAIVLIVSPGTAVDGLLALFVLLVCGISLLFDSRRARRSRTAGPARPVRRR